MIIYFIRHTDADDDRRDSFGGITDDPLIDSGRKYAKKVGEELKSEGIEVIYTSPYTRARETADLINDSLNVDVVEIFNLRERNSYGVISGIEKKLVKKLFPSIYERIEIMKEMGKKPSTSIETLPGAEIYLDLILRARNAFNQIFREAKLGGFKKVSVVTHGGFAYAFFNEVLKVDLELQKGKIIVLEGNNIDSLKIRQK